jgi:hypothetical protein
LEYRLVEQLVERVEEHALEGPVAVVLEDLHWADPATVVALRALGRRLAHLPIALLGTFRPSPRSLELERLIETWQHEGALHLTLAPLEHPDVIELAAELTGGRPGPELERQLSSAAGNPLFVTELLGSLAEDGVIEFGDGMAELTERSLPPSLRLTILRRVAALGDSTLALLRTASVLGTTFSPLDLATVTGRPAAGVVDELLEARRAGVVEEAGALLRFRHDVVREALYDDLPPSQRAELHLAVGAAITRLAGEAAGERLTIEADELVVATGLRPDLSLLAELRLDLDPALECPRALGPLIDPNEHSCGTVRPHGAAELAQPEPGLFLVGMKSYGRAPTFLLATGHEQVRSVAAHLAGDEEAARRVELELPETGVCSGPAPSSRQAGTPLAAATSCCGPTVRVAAPAASAPVTGCCGGPAPAGADACCVDDAVAKAEGREGCGCAAPARTERPPAAPACCAAA